MSRIRRWSLLVMIAGLIPAAEVSGVITGYGVITYDDSKWVLQKTEVKDVTTSTLANSEHTKTIAFIITGSPGADLDQAFPGIERVLKKDGDVQVLGSERKDKDAGYVLSARIHAANKVVWNTTLLMQRRKHLANAIVAFYATQGDPRKDPELQAFWQQIVDHAAQVVKDAAK